MAADESPEMRDQGTVKKETSFRASRYSGFPSRSTFQESRGSSRIASRVYEGRAGLCMQAVRAWCSLLGDLRRCSENAARRVIEEVEWVGVVEAVAGVDLKEVLELRSSYFAGEVAVGEARRNLRGVERIRHMSDLALRLQQPSKGCWRHLRAVESSLDV